MYINEIEKGSTVTLTVGVKGNDKTLTLITNAIGTYGTEKEHALQTEAIRYNEKLLNYKNCIATAEVIVNGRPHIFNVSTIQNIIYEEENYCVIYSDTNAQPINRRGACRYQMIGDAIVRLGSNSKLYRCFTHDLSVTGISFIIDEPIDVGENVEVTALFESQGLRCNVKSLVKRTHFDEKTNTTLIGCEIEGNTQLIEQLVATLMRKQANKYRGR